MSDSKELKEVIVIDLEAIEENDNTSSLYTGHEVIMVQSKVQDSTEGNAENFLTKDQPVYIPNRGHMPPVAIIDSLGLIDTLPKKTKKAKKKLAETTALQELVTKGMTGTGLSTVTSRINYQLVDDFSAIRRLMAKPATDVNSIQVLTQAHNCIHAAQGFARSVFRSVPNLIKADQATPKTSRKLGKFSMAAYDIKGQDAKLFVNNMYVQFCLGIPNRGAPENNMHVSQRAIRNALRSIILMHPESTNHGLIIFGEDTDYPTNWSIIEDTIEDLCEQLNITLTVFIPRFYVVSSNQKLDGRLAAFLRNTGMLL